MDTMELILLYDYYGALLTGRQRECFEMRYHQDLSLGEIGEELGISRQGVHDNLSRTEALLRNMEEKTGCVARARRQQASLQTICHAAEQLLQLPGAEALAKEILAAVDDMKE